MRPLTDAGGEETEALSPGVANLIGLLRLGGNTEQADEFQQAALAGDLMYGHLKVAVADHVVELLTPIRERREQLSDDEIRQVLAAGAERARGLAQATMARVRRLIGVGAAALH